MSLVNTFVDKRSSLYNLQPVIDDNIAVEKKEVADTNPFNKEVACDRFLFELYRLKLIDENGMLLPHKAPMQLPHLGDEEEKRVLEFLKTELHFLGEVDPNALTTTHNLLHSLLRYDGNASIDVVGGAVIYLLGEGYLRRVFDALDPKASALLSDELLRGMCQPPNDYDLRYTLKEATKDRINQFNRVEKLTEVFFKALARNKDLLNEHAFEKLETVKRGLNRFRILTLCDKACDKKSQKLIVEYLLVVNLARYHLFYQDRLHLGLEFDLSSKNFKPFIRASTAPFNHFQAFIDRIGKIIHAEDIENIDMSGWAAYHTYLSKGYRSLQKGLEESLKNNLLSNSYYNVDSIVKNAVKFLTKACDNHLKSSPLAAITLTFNASRHLSLFPAHDLLLRIWQGMNLKVDGQAPLQKSADILLQGRLSFIELSKALELAAFYHYLLSPSTGKESLNKPFSPHLTRHEGAAHWQLRYAAEGEGSATQSYNLLVSCNPVEVLSWVASLESDDKIAAIIDVVDVHLQTSFNSVSKNCRDSGLWQQSTDLIDKALALLSHPSKRLQDLAAKVIDGLLEGTEVVKAWQPWQLLLIQKVFNLLKQGLDGCTEDPLLSLVATMLSRKGLGCSKKSLASLSTFQTFLLKAKDNTLKNIALNSLSIEVERLIEGKEVDAASVLLDDKKDIKETARISGLRVKIIDGFIANGSYVKALEALFAAFSECGKDERRLTSYHQSTLNVIKAINALEEVPENLLNGLCRLLLTGTFNDLYKSAPNTFNPLLARTIPLMEKYSPQSLGTLLEKVLALAVNDKNVLSAAAAALPVAYGAARAKQAARLSHLILKQQKAFFAVLLAKPADGKIAKVVALLHARGASLTWDDNLAKAFLSSCQALFTFNDLNSIVIAANCLKDLWSSFAVQHKLAHGPSLIEELWHHKQSHAAALLSLEYVAIALREKRPVKDGCAVERWCLAMVGAGRYADAAEMLNAAFSLRHSIPWLELAITVVREPSLSHKQVIALLLKAAEHGGLTSKQKEECLAVAMQAVHSSLNDRSKGNGAIAGIVNLLEKLGCRDLSLWNIILKSGDKKNIESSWRLLKPEGYLTALLDDNQEDLFKWRYELICALKERESALLPKLLSHNDPLGAIVNDRSSSYYSLCCTALLQWSFNFNDPFELLSPLFTPKILADDAVIVNALVELSRYLRRSPNNQVNKVYWLKALSDAAKETSAQQEGLQVIRTFLSSSKVSKELAEVIYAFLIEYLKKGDGFLDGDCLKVLEHDRFAALCGKEKKSACFGAVIMNSFKSAEKAPSKEAVDAAHSSFLTHFSKVIKEDPIAELCIAEALKNVIYIAYPLLDIEKFKAAANAIEKAIFEHLQGDKKNRAVASAAKNRGRNSTKKAPQQKKRQDSAIEEETKEFTLEEYKIVLSYKRKFESLLLDAVRPKELDEDSDNVAIKALGSIIEYITGNLFYSLKYAKVLNYSPQQISESLDIFEKFVFSTIPLYNSLYQTFILQCSSIYNAMKMVGFFQNDPEKEYAISLYLFFGIKSDSEMSLSTDIKREILKMIVDKFLAIDNSFIVGRITSLMLMNVSLLFQQAPQEAFVIFSSLLESFKKYFITVSSNIWYYELLGSMLIELYHLKGVKESAARQEDYQKLVKEYVSAVSSIFSDEKRLDAARRENRDPLDYLRTHFNSKFF